MKSASKLPFFKVRAKPIKTANFDHKTIRIPKKNKR